MTIKATIIADSVSNGVRLTTLELEYPRFIHSQMMTHRMFSRNASSSRAIPVEKIIKEVEENPAMPIHWGKNQPGMQAGEECTTEILSEDILGDYRQSREKTWLDALDCAKHFAECFSKAGYHKQIVNRLLEPFSHIKVILTATEWDNFFKLRLHEDAQPEIQELARVMLSALQASKPHELNPGEWHLPYVNWLRVKESDGDLDTLIKCSVARCARVSYNNHDNSTPDIEKDIKLADKLLAAGHMSCFEHQATPMKEIEDELISYFYQEGCGIDSDVMDGVTHFDVKGNPWSNNFRGWIQYRALL